MVRRVLGGLFLGLLLGISPSIWGSAQTAGTSQAQIHFYSTTTTTDESSKRQIPQGDVVYQTHKGRSEDTLMTGKLRQALVSGRLPQTGTNINHYYQLVGMMSLVALLLGWQDARLISERGRSCAATTTRI